MTATMTKALILVDFENEWIDKKSDYYVGDISGVIKKTNKLIDYCRKKKYKIIFIRHVEKESKREFKEKSKNTQIISTIDRQSTDALITKYKISPFYKTRLEKELRNVKEIVVCGILTNLCVRSLVQDSYDRDFKITVIEDCCVAFSKKIHDFTIKDLKETRPEIDFRTLKEFLK
jgi:nicotinamidase-related amidase